MRAIALLANIIAETIQSRKEEQAAKKGQQKDTFLDKVKKEYDSEFHRCYPQVPMHSSWGKGRDSVAVLRVFIRGEQQPHMTPDETISSIARFKRKGRPFDKWGRMMAE
jgi:hypothetical protein